MLRPLRVLILGDEPDASLIVEELRRADFAPDWQRVDTEEDYVARLLPRLDLILAHYKMMSKVDALQALAILQARGLDIPFIVVADPIGEEIVVECMKRGAADCLLRDRLGRLGLAVTQTLEKKRLRDAKRETEAALRESEERFRQMAETVQEVFWMSTSDLTQTLYISPAYERIWGRSRASLYESPRSFMDAIHPEDRARVEAKVEEQRTGLPAEVEYRILRPDGTVRWVRDRGFPIRDGAGQIYRITGIATDITRLKAAEEALQQYMHRLEATRDIDRAILELQTPEELAQALVGHIYRLVPCRRASIILFDHEREQARVAAVAQDVRIEPAVGTVFPLRDLPNNEFWQAVGQRIDNLTALPNPPPALQRLIEQGIRSAISVLLAAEGTPLGQVKVVSDRVAAFRPEHETTVRELADHLAVAVRNSRLFEQVRAGRERLRSLSCRLVDVHEQERRHIARELHDEIGQTLTGLRLMLETALQLRPEALPGRLEAAEGLVNDLLTRVRNLSLDLRPAMLDDLGLLPALLWFLDRYSMQTGVQVAFEHAGLEERFAPEVETAAYRIVQEALTNVARHAGISEATVRVWATPTSLGAQVQDRGRGFDDTTTPSGATGGLTGMRERTMLLGGKFAVESMPGQGSRVTAEFPRAEPFERRSDERPGAAGR